LSPAKTAEPILGADSHGPDEPRVRRGAHWRHLSNTIEQLVRCGDAALRPVPLASRVHIFMFNNYKVPRIGRRLTSPWPTSQFAHADLYLEAGSAGSSFVVDNSICLIQPNQSVVLTRSPIPCCCLSRFLQSVHQTSRRQARTQNAEGSVINASGGTTVRRRGKMSGHRRHSLRSPHETTRRSQRR